MLGSLTNVDFRKMGGRMLLTHWILLIWILHYSEAIDITCGTVRPKVGESVACTCSTQSGNDIDWQKDGSTISTCLSSSGNCLPKPAIYEFSNDVTGSTKEFNLTIKAFSYTDCANFSCTDGTPAQETLGIAAFDENQTFTSSEPQNKTGNITVTSSCLYMASDVTVSWYKVVNGKESLYTDETPLKSSDSAACSDQCAGVSAETVMSTLYHEEVTSKFEMGKLRVKFKHSYFAQSKTWTSSVEYQLRKDSTTNSTPLPTGAANATDANNATDATNAATTMLQTTTQNNLTSADSSQKKITIIACVVVGIVLLAVVFAFCYYFHYKRQEQKKKEKNRFSAEMHTHEHTGETVN